MSSRWACIETYSPAAIEKAPATSPARPVRRTTAPLGWAAATPTMSETLVTSPSLMPKTAARATPGQDHGGDGRGRLQPGGASVERSDTPVAGLAESRVTQRKWFDPAQPQTLQAAVLFSYLTAGLGVLFLLFSGRALADPDRSGGRPPTASPTSGACGLPGGRRAGLALPAGQVLSLLVGRSFGGLLDLVFAGVLVALLVHPDSRAVPEDLVPLSGAPPGVGGRWRGLI